MQWLLSSEFRAYILDNGWFFPLLFLARLVLMTSVEKWRPATPVAYRSAILHDLAALLLYQFVVFPLASSITQVVAVHPHWPSWVQDVPLLLRLVAYLIVADLGHYWIHRLMHTRYVWRVHQWHHAPTTMYWLAGVRATVPQQVLVNLPYVFALSLLDVSPWWLALSIATLHILQNDWMHLNVSWRLRWLERIVVTPRYHHLHHSDDPALHRANYAALFTVWDRLFGTYANPDSVAKPVSFGLGAPAKSVRLVIGL